MCLNIQSAWHIEVQASKFHSLSLSLQGGTQTMSQALSYEETHTLLCVYSTRPPIIIYAP